MGGKFLAKVHFFVFFSQYGPEGCLGYILQIWYFLQSLLFIRLYVMMLCHFVWHNLWQGHNNCQKSPSCTNWQRKKIVTSRYIVDDTYKVLDTQSLICPAMLLTSVPHCHYAAPVYFTSGVCAVNTTTTEYWILQCWLLTVPLQNCILHRDHSYPAP